MRTVEVLPERARKGRPLSAHWNKVAQDLRGLPEGKWGVVETDVPIHRSQLVRMNLSKRGDFQVVYRGGTVYAKEVRS